MIIIGVDYHPSFQQISFMDQETGECGERRLNHSDGEAERFYKELKERGVSVRVGLKATGYSRWFERLLAELGFEVWIGDAAEIQRQRGRKQKTDRRDAELLLKLLLENRFPRIWVPSPENRDLVFSGQRGTEICITLAQARQNLLLEASRQLAVRWPAS
jgi:transposase